MGQLLTQFSQDLGEIYARVGRSVVAISANRKQTSSGFFVGQNQIVTSDHDLHHEEGIVVTLPDGASAQVHLVGRDHSTDIALLEFDEPIDEQPILDRVADINSLQVGSLVLALARAPEDGLGAALGVLSCRSGSWRTWRGARVEVFLQPDVNLYPGFSGGPLVDSEGRLLGLNTSGLSRAGAITLPYTTLDRITEALRTPGQSGRAYLGVGLRSVQLPQKLKELGTGGAMVVSLEADSAADRDGLLLGDILIGLNDQAVESTEETMAILADLKAGQSVSTRLIRAGQALELQLTTGQRPQRGCH